MRIWTKALHFLLFPFLTASWSFGCGILLDEARSHYEGVDFQGHVNLIEKLADLEVGQERKQIPIYLIFNSGNGYISPYSGTFDIPLLTSRMEQVDDNTFLLRSPTGWLLPFRRSAKDKTILNGSSGMMAQVDDAKGIITAWAECGDKLTFSQGRLIEWQNKETKLSYVYSQGQLSEIREGGATVLKVEINPNSGVVKGLSLGMNEKIHFEWGQKPRVQGVAGKNLVVGMDMTLTGLTLADGTKKSFEFEIDDLIQPSIRMNDNRKVTWDPTTKKILKDNEWSYEIKPNGEDRFAYAAISRSDEGGRKESWLYDPVQGLESIVRADGYSRKRSWFTSGKLAGRPRRITDFMNGEEIRDRKWNYDESGKILRLIDSAEKNFALQRKIASWLKNPVIAQLNTKE